MKKRVEMPAPLWKRAFAYVIDALIISLITAWPASALSSKTMFTSWSGMWAIPSQEAMKQMIMLTLVIAIITILYWALLEYKLGQSVGKMLMRIKVVSKTSQPLTFSQCLIRNLSKFSSLLLVIDTLYMAKSKTQRFLDKKAGTKVVELLPRKNAK